MEGLLSHEAFTGVGWEPACGDGHISRFFPGIMCSDIRHDHIAGEGGVDFLLERHQVDFIVTNPPYSLAQQFVEHALECADKIAMLLRIQFLESKSRGLLFKKNPPARIHVFSDRVNCDPSSASGRGGMMCFAWFIWDKQYQGPTVLDWIGT